MWFAQNETKGCKFTFTVEASLCQSLPRCCDGHVTTLEAVKALSENIDSLRGEIRIKLVVLTMSIDLQDYLCSIFSRVNYLDIIPCRNIEEIHLKAKKCDQSDRVIVLTEDHYKVPDVSAAVSKLRQHAGTIILTRDEGSLSPKLKEYQLPATVLRRPVRPAAVLKAVQQVLIDSLMSSGIGLGAFPGPAQRQTIAPRPAQETQGSSAFAGKHPLRIMVVDDNQFNLQLMKRILKRFGYDDAKIVAAENGWQALDTFMSYATDTPQPRPIDLIFMDMEMPEMNGCEAAREIRKKFVEFREDALPTSPHIIALTANAFPEDREACLTSGMCRYMSKPIDTIKLEQEIVFACRALKNEVGCKCNEEWLTYRSSR